MGLNLNGREQAKTTPTAVARTPDLSNFYRFKLPSITPGDFTFHLDLLRPKLPDLSLDNMVDTLSWVDEQSVMTGNITAYRPDLADATTLPAKRGHLLRCRVAWDGTTYDLWTMRLQAPQIEVETGMLSMTFQDDMALLDGGGFDWWFRKTKNRPYGYTCDEIAAVVAAKLGVKIRKAAKGTTRMQLKMRNASGLAVLKKAYLNEKNAAGRSFIIRMRDGELEIVPLQRNPIVYVLGSQIQTALLTETTGQAVPTTVLTGKAHIGTGKKSKSISYTEYDKKAVSLLGYSHDTVDYGKVASSTELKNKVQRELAKRLRVTTSAEISQQGIPFLLRGDGAEIDLPSEGYSGAKAFMFCTSATHTVQAGVYQTDWVFTAADPYLAAQRADVKAAAARAAKRAKRARAKLKKAGS